MVKISSFSENQIRKWTVATVHWKSYEYLYWQLKTLYDYNNPNDFELCIFDGMFPHNDNNLLENLINDYKRYKNIKLFFWESFAEKGLPHGSELTEILRRVNSKYVIFNDPDCFWLVHGHLDFLESFLMAGNRSVGVQHRTMSGPAIYGAAYYLQDIKNCDLSATWHYCQDCKKGTLVKNQDTGWQLNLRTSHLPMQIFRETTEKTPRFGKYSHGRPDCFQSYQYKDNLVATHLFRGIYKQETAEEIYPEFWLKNRMKYGQYFYENCKKL